MNKFMKILLVGMIVVVLIGLVWTIYKVKNKEISYMFPDDYISIACPAFVGETNGTCFTSYDNNSIVLKEGTSYQSFTKQEYKNETNI